MKTRLIAIGVAVVLGVVGTVVLVRYVRNADARALAGTETVEVLMVTGPIPVGTSGDQLADLVEATAVPAMAAVTGRIASLDQLTGQFAVVDLVPGEQILPNQFATPELLSAADRPDIPDGFQQVTVLLSSQRALGGELRPGDRVGVYLSFAPDVMIYSTHLTLDQVLVTAVRSAVAATDSESDTETTAAPVDSPAADDPAIDTGVDVYVTFAVTGTDAEALLFGAEHGTLWLSLVTAGATDADTRVIQPDNVYAGATEPTEIPQ